MIMVELRDLTILYHCKEKHQM